MLEPQQPPRLRGLLAIHDVSPVSLRACRLPRFLCAAPACGGPVEWTGCAAPQRGSAARRPRARPAAPPARQCAHPGVEHEGAMHLLGRHLHALPHGGHVDGLRIVPAAEVRQARWRFRLDPFTAEGIEGLAARDALAARRRASARWWPRHPPPGSARRRPRGRCRARSRATSGPRAGPA